MRSMTRPGSSSSTASARPRCCTSSSPPRTTTSAPADRSGRAGLRGARRRRRGQPVPDGTPGHLAVKGPTGCRYLADPGRRSTSQTAGTSPATPTPRRRRLLPVPGAHRRHDHLGRIQHRRAGGRGGMLAHPDVLECAVVGLPTRPGQPWSRLRRPPRASVATRLASASSGPVKSAIAPYKCPRRSSSWTPARPHRQAPAVQAAADHQALPSRAGASTADPHPLRALRPGRAQLALGLCRRPADGGPGVDSAGALVDLAAQRRGVLQAMSWTAPPAMRCPTTHWSSCVRATSASSAVSAPSSPTVW